MHAPRIPKIWKNLYLASFVHSSFWDLYGAFCFLLCLMSLKCSLCHSSFHPSVFPSFDQSGCFFGREKINLRWENSLNLQGIMLIQSEYKDWELSDVMPLLAFCLYVYLLSLFFSCRSLIFWTKYQRKGHVVHHIVMYTWRNIYWMLAKAPIKKSLIDFITTT